MVAMAMCLTGSAVAQVPRQVRFEYARQDGAGACPDLATIQAGVAARLGYDPFSDRAGDLVRATIQQSGRGIEARIEMTDAKGSPRAERRLLSHQRDCAELASSVELAISIAIDPFRLSSALPVSGTRERGPEATQSPGQGAGDTSAQGSSPASVAKESIASPAPRQPLSGRVEASLLGAVGVAPSRALGFAVGAGIRGGNLSLAIEGRADFPASASLRVGEASTALLVASLLPCAHFRMMATCALASAGVLRAAGHGLVDARKVTLPYVAVGARLAAAIPLTPRLSLAIHGDLTTPLTESRIEVDGAPVWTSPKLAFALGVGVAANFP
jgi:hypothetical protein